MAKKTEYQVLLGKFTKQEKSIKKLENEVHDLYIRSTLCKSPVERQELLRKGSELRIDLQFLRKELDDTHYAMYHKKYYV